MEEKSSKMGSALGPPSQKFNELPNHMVFKLKLPLATLQVTIQRRRPLSSCFGIIIDWNGEIKKQYKVLWACSLIKHGPFHNHRFEEALIVAWYLLNNPT